MKVNRYTIALLSMLASGAYADEGIRLGQPSYGGTGCPAGTASATLSPDATSLSILFDAYQVEAGGMTGRRSDRKSCNVAIPVTVPQGYSVSIIQIDYRGFNSLPQGAMSRFNVEYFFAGAQGPAFARDFYGPSSDDFLINNQLEARAVVWSACGADANLRANTGLFVQTNGYGEQAMSSVDTADVQASVVFQLQWRRCDGGSPVPVPDFPPRPQPQPPIPPAPPVPPPAYSDCSIQTVTDYYGRVTYRVLDRFSRVLGEYRDFYQAQEASRMFERAGQCRGGGGYNPPPPRPVPPPHYGEFRCVVSTRFGQQFTGIGPTPDQATARARNACIHEVNNSFVCTQAPVSCYRQ